MENSVAPLERCRRYFFVMVVVCEKCGDVGFEELLVYCDKCRVSAEHRYCFNKLPEPLYGPVNWTCGDCKISTAAKDLTCDNPNPVELRKSGGKRKKKVKSSIRKRKKLKRIKDSTSKVEAEYPRCEVCPSPQPQNDYIKSKSTQTVPLSSEKHEEDLNLVTDRRLMDVDAVRSDEFFESPSSKEKHEEDKNLAIDSRRSMLLDGAQSGEVSGSRNGINDRVNISYNDSYSLAQPIFDPIWRGSLSISGHNFGIMDGLAAHISNKACLKVHEAANLLPKIICLEVFPRLDVWPKSFEKSQPTDDSIALYLFPENERYRNAFDILVDDLIGDDLGMRAVVGNAELLIFPSIQLPLQLWRFQGSYYLWGVFRGKQSPTPPKADDCVMALSSSDHCVVPISSLNAAGTMKKDLGKKGKPWDMRSPVTPLSNCV